MALVVVPHRPPPLLSVEASGPSSSETLLDAIKRPLPEERGRVLLRESGQAWTAPSATEARQLRITRCSALLGIEAPAPAGPETAEASNEARGGAEPSRARSAWQSSARRVNLSGVEAAAGSEAGGGEVAESPHEPHSPSLFAVARAAEAEKDYRRAAVLKKIKDRRSAMASKLGGKLGGMKGSAASQAADLRQIVKEEAKKGPVHLLRFLCRKLCDTIGMYWRRLITVTRSEHTIVSFMYPNEDEVDLGQLTDMQIAQIFWETLLLELTMLAFLFDPTDEGGGTIITTIRDTMIIVTPCCVAAMLFKQLFRWGNAGYRRRQKRENKRALQTIVEKGQDRAKKRGSKRASRELRKSLNTAASKRKTKGRRRFHFRCRTPRYWKITVAWIFVVLVNLVCAMSCIVFAAGFGNEQTGQFLADYFTGIMYSYGIIEPFQILLLVFLPFLLDGPIMTELRTQYNNLFG